VPTTIIFLSIFNHKHIFLGDSECVAVNLFYFLNRFYVILLGLGFWESLFRYFIRFKVMGIFMSYFIRFRLGYRYMLIPSRERELFIIDFVE
jgi:hypothetical protein